MRKDSETRQRILDVTIAAIEKDGSRNVRIAEVANRTRVGVPTIYYHFESRTQLIAEAQMAIYQRMTQSLHVHQPRILAALAGDDREAFLNALGENTEMAWQLGQLDEKWGIVKLLLDVWSQPKVRDQFCEMLDVQFERWNDAMEHAKDLGWIDPRVDSRTLVATFWAASIGQVITSNSPHFNPSPADVRAFFELAMGVDRVDRSDAFEAALGFDSHVGHDPIEPAGHPPVGLADEVHQRGHQHSAQDERVHQNRTT